MQSESFVVNEIYNAFNFLRKCISLIEFGLGARDIDLQSVWGRE